MVIICHLRLKIHQITGLPRRFAPRNDAGVARRANDAGVASKVRHCERSVAIQY